MRREFYTMLASGTLLLAACQNVSASPTPTFEKRVIIDDDWIITRTGEKDFIIEDDRDGSYWPGQRQDFLGKVLVTLQDKHGCVILEHEIVTNGSKRIKVEDPDCILNIYQAEDDK